MSTNSADVPVPPTLKKPGLFESMSLAGATAIIVVNFTHPIEVVKTRMQVAADYSMGQMLKAEGYASLYKGIQVLLRHFTSLHFTSLHFTSLHLTSLHFTSLHFT